MSDKDPPYTTVQIYLRRRMWLLELALLAVLALLLIGLAVVIVAVVGLVSFSGKATPAYPSDRAHFMYGSIGSEPDSGLPYAMWKALPSIYPEAFKGRKDYSAFGFVYQTDAHGRQSDLPVGISRRQVMGVDVVWFNCATCHAGTWRAGPGEPAHIVPGMPSNNLDLYRFIRFVLDMAADERITPDELIPAMEKAGSHFSPMDALVWRYLIIPKVRETAIERRTRLLPLLAAQPPWGPGRVDTFNPYKLLLEFPVGARVPDAELVGTTDFPAIFDQREKEGMHLHWDGNNTSLAERNLSAAIGAGVTVQSVDHAAIERDAAWLRDLKPPPSPYHPDPAAVARGKSIYMGACVGCHGWREPTGYVFKGHAVGEVDPIGDVATDPNRLNSYTEPFREWQEAYLFAGTRWRFSHFTKTGGYANLPLDGLWLRAPYLHNGSVPTLADLLEPPAARPKAFLRASDVIDPVNGGFQAPPCDPTRPVAAGFCFDTGARGNSPAGHAYGTDLPAPSKQDLLAYLLTF